MNRRTRRTRLSGVLALAFALTGSGCLSAGTHQGAGGGDAARGSVVIHVVNANAAQVRVLLVQGSVPNPLGTVGSFERRTLHISPAELGGSGTLTLQVQPFGFDPHTLEPVLVAPGATLELHVGANVKHTYLTPRAQL